MPPLPVAATLQAVQHPDSRAVGLIGVIPSEQCWPLANISLVSCVLSAVCWLCDPVVDAAVFGNAAVLVRHAVKVQTWWCQAKHLPIPCSCARHSKRFISSTMSGLHPGPPASLRICGVSVFFVSHAMLLLLLPCSPCTAQPFFPVVNQGRPAQGCAHHLCQQGLGGGQWLHDERGHTQCTGTQAARGVPVRAKLCQGGVWVAGRSVESRAG
jgi:hypothetical protein